MRTDNTENLQPRTAAARCFSGSTIITSPPDGLEIVIKLGDDDGQQGEIDFSCVDGIVSVDLPQDKRFFRKPTIRRCILNG